MSQQEFLLPDVGEGLVEAEIVAWKVAVGDTVTLNQPIADIETAKATVEIPSPYAGVVVALHGKVGDVMEVHKPFVTFDVGGASDAAPAAAAEPAAEAPSHEAVLVGYGVANEDGVATRQHRRQGRRGATTPPVPPVAPTAPAAPALAPRSTPPVRLYAKQHGLSIDELVGTGPDGLITRDDVERALSGAPSPASAPAAPAPAAGGVVPSAPAGTSRFVGRDLESWTTGPKEERIPVRGVLRSMAESMTQSAFSIPRAAVWVRTDATKTMELVAALKQRPALAGVRVSPLVIVALALVDAARHYPGLNSSFDEEAGEVVVRRTVNLGIAADTPRGLIVPNIKGADELGLVGMAQALNALVDTARAGTTTPNAMLGTTLTITNVGPMNVDAAIPIIPPGTGAILAIGQIARAPWVVDDEVQVRHVAELALSFDHRMIDGALASRALRHVADFLADPALSMIAG